MSYDLMQELEQKKRELSACNKQLAINGREKAEAEKNYKMKVTKEVLRLREEKMPVTMINLIVYGIEEVAELRFKRDIAETVYEANKEAINATKLQIRILENQISREWGSKDGGL